MNREDLVVRARPNLQGLERVCVHRIIPRICSMEDIDRESIAIASCNVIDHMNASAPEGRVVILWETSFLFQGKEGNPDTTICYYWVTSLTQVQTHAEIGEFPWYRVDANGGQWGQYPDEVVDAAFAQLNAVEAGAGG